jgi:AraC family transcriptional regulator of adaptative response / DNA-3-methyladenine glycosylase II
MLATALADGTVVLDAGTDAEAARWSLRALPGIGPWTADYIAMRALGHPDIVLPGDVGVRRALAVLGVATPGAVDAVAARWRPWRSYATVHLWRHQGPSAVRAS